MVSRSRELLRRYFLPQWRWALTLLLLLLVTTAVQLAQPRLLASFIDSARAGHPLPVLTRIALIYLGLAITAQAVAVAEAYLTEHVALVATNRLRADLTQHCLELDLSFHNEHGPGEMIQRIDGDVARLANFFSRFLVVLLANGLLLIGVVVVLGTIDVRLGIGVGVFAVAVLAVLLHLRRIAAPLWERLMVAQADQASYLEEHLSATEDLRSSGATEYASRGFVERARAVLRREQRAVFVGNSIGALTSALFTIGTAAALALAVWLFRRGEITIGTVFLIFMYTQMLALPIQTIQRQIADLQAASAAIHRVYELLDATPNVVDGPSAELPAGALSVRFEGVDFRYIEHEPLLRDVSLELEAGRVLGVLGRTGSGKTTISRLLLRFYDPDAGTVRVGDIDVRQPTLAQLRGRIGLVTQDVQLFHASVRDNLTFFESTITDTAVESAVREVGLGDWYDNLPDGLDTTITSRGTGLSAGEAQLLAFARVFLRNPGLVILDEATSRLDPVTEGRVEHAVNRLFEGRTAVVIAHRLRTVLRADQIAVVDDGAIVEHGDRVTLGADPASRFSRLLAAGMEDARS